MTILTRSITYGKLLIPILIIYAVSTFIIFKLPLAAKQYEKKLLASHNSSYNSFNHTVVK